MSSSRKGHTQVRPPRGAESRVLADTASDGQLQVRVRTDRGEWVRIHGARPEAEAQQAVDRALGSEPVPPVVGVIGVGLGYTIDELRARRPDVRIVALEVLPELVSLWRKRVDVRAVEASGSLVVAADPDYRLPAAAWPADALAGDPPVIVHPALAHYFPDAVARAKAALAQFLFERRANEEARQRLAPLYLTNTLENMVALAGAADITALRGIAAGDAVILCGAGPSLDTLLPALRDAQARAWLVALDTAVRPLMAAGIVPDLVVSIDPSPLNGRHLLNLPGRQRPWLVAETSLDPRAIAAFAGRLFACRINRADPWPWLEQTGAVPTKVRAWGSVLTTACDLVTNLGASRVAFAAVDLAYTNGQPYCRGTSFEADWAEQIKVQQLPSVEAVWEERLSRNVVEEPDVTGRTTRTAAHLIAFRNWVRTLVAETPSCAFANVTGAGILHGAGIAQVSLDVWLQGCPVPGASRDERLARAARPAWLQSRRPLLDALGRALETTGEPWTGWTSRVPRVGRTDLARVLELTRRRLRAGRGAGAMSTSESDWIDVPYDAANFYASAPMQWHVQDDGRLVYSYRIDGKTMMLSFKISRSTIVGPPTRQLFLKLPAGHLVARGTASAVYIGSRIVREMGYATVHPGHDKIVIHRGNEEPFPVEDGFFFVFGQMFLEIQ
ncbi:MAG: 6-hydroxymethylpterin diphosphokinase MptE-like protein [Vicinamibacterales bacterium]